MKKAFSNKTDIYRRTAIEIATDEHVIPAALGGSLHMTGAIDSLTNTKFGSTIDKALVESLSAFRCLAGLRSRRGDELFVESLEGEYDLQGDTPVLKRKQGEPWEVKRHEDGSMEISFLARSPEHAQELARHALRRVGKTEGDIKEWNARRVREYVPPLRFPIGIGTPIHDRAVAKIFLNAACFILGPDAVLRPEFDTLRSYVMDGVDRVDDLESGTLKAPQELAGIDCRELACSNSAGGSSAVAHELVLRGSSEHRVLYGQLKLFSALRFSCLLTREWDGGDIVVQILNPVSGEEKETTVTELDFEAWPGLSAEDALKREYDPHKLKIQLETAVGAVHELASNRATNKLISGVLAEVLGSPDGSIFTQEKANVLASRMAEEFVKHLYRLPSEETLPPPELD